MIWRRTGSTVVLVAISLLALGCAGYLVACTAQEHGPRIEFQGFQADTRGPNDELIVRSVNTGDADITAAALSAELVTSKYPDTVRNPDISTAEENVRASLQKAALLPDPLKFRRGAVAKSDRFIVPHADVKAALSGEIFLYIIFMAKYVARDTPAGHVWVTETCADIVLPYTDFQPCAGFPNSHFMADKTLRRLD